MYTLSHCYFELIIKQKDRFIYLSFNQEINLIVNTQHSALQFHLFFMKKYLPQIYSSMVSPAIKLDNNVLSLSRYLNKRAMLKQCRQLWNLQNEDELDRQIAQSYLSLKDAVQTKNYPMALRYLSPPLYDQLTENPSLYKFQDSISDVSILNCAKTKDQSNGAEWFHISVVIKHYSSQYLYGLERRIYTQNHQFSQSFKRKWCFNQLPLRQDHNTNN